MTYWKNPWEDAISVPIEELARCYQGLNEYCGRMDGSRFLWTEEEILKHWRQHGDRLDAYILPCVSGFHCIGIRYGNEGHQYLSPLGDKEKVQALLDQYRK